jgi:predicted ATP-dependent endonuclease of OLD family
MLQEISAQQDKSQIIVATHSNMIASRLNLNNVLWITEIGVKSLSGVDKKIAEFFVKADDNSFLQLLLSEKVILVEGATEFLLLPDFYKQIKHKSLEEDSISIISCNGISYKNYLEIATATGKKVAVITDNDKKQERIDYAEKFNGVNNMQHIYMGADINDWTWEACVYHANKEKLDMLIKTTKTADYKVHGQPCESKVLGKMLNNKVNSAYQMQISGITFEVPQYVKDAISWLNE